MRSASLLKRDASSAWEVVVQVIVKGPKVPEQREHQRLRCSSVYELLGERRRGVEIEVQLCQQRLEVGGQIV